MWKKIFGKDIQAKQQTEDMKLDPAKMPRHVAIIMDGNGRWANGRGLLRTAGHRAGVTTLKEILRTANDLHIEALTVYAFSTENWKRPNTEVDFLMKLFSEYLAKELDEMDRDHVKIRFLGKVEELSPGLQQQIEQAQTRTMNNTGICFNIAVNYGGRDELVQAVREIAVAAAEKRISVQDIDDELVENALYTKGLPSVDLLIRTSGDLRLSNFLLWQSAYAEFWFTDVNWPDFTPACFLSAIADFQKRERRFGGLKHQ